MIKHFNKLIFCAITAMMVLAVSCKKADNKPSTNNNTNTGNTNPAAPSILVYDQLGQDTTVPSSYFFRITIQVKASATANLDSMIGNDGLGYTFKVIFGGLGKGAKVSQTKDSTFYDHYQVPASATGTTVSLVYTVYGQGKTNTITRKIKVVSVPIFTVGTKIPLYDQTQGGNSAFLNTGGNPKPILYTEGDVGSNPSLRNLVDMCAAHTAGQTDILFSPGWVNSASGSPSKTFSDSNIFNINNGWTLAQRNTTLFKKVPLNDYATKYTNEADVKALYIATVGSGSPRVQFSFQTNDNYVFLTADGRYGVLTVDALNPGVLMDLAVESR